MNNMDIKLGHGFHSLYNIPSAMAQNRSVIMQKEQQINVNSHGKSDQSMQSKQKQKQDIQQAEQENIYHNDNDNHNHHQHQHQHQRQIHNQNKNHQELFNGADQDHHQEEEEEEEEEEEDEEGAHGEAGGEEAMAPLKKGPWTAEEDALLLSYVSKHGDGNWNTVQKYSGVSRNGKSCRLRWTNHLRPHLKKGAFSAEEERIIIEQHAAIGNRWSRIAAMLPGRTDNEIKNFWNTRKKRRLRAGLSLYPAGVKPTNSSSSNTTTNNNGASTSSSCSDSPESMITSLRLGEDGSDINSSMTMIDHHHQFSSICSSFSNNLIQAASHHPTSMAIIHTEQPVAFPSEISIVGQSSRRCADVSADVKKTQIAMSSTEPSLNVHGLKRGREATGFHQPLGNSMNFRYFSAHQSAAAALARAQSVTTFHQIRNLNILRSMDPFRRTQAFPYEPEPPDPCNMDPCSVIRSHGIFIPTDSQHPIFPSDLSESHNNPSAEARSKNPFMSISNHRDDDEQKHLHGLKMELPSVQLTESADSSSGLSSPFTTPPPPPTACHNMLPLSEVDSFGSTRNNTNETISSTSDGSSLLDAVFIQSVPLNLDQFLTSNKSIADHRPSAVSPCSRNASPMVSSSSSSSSSRNVSPMPDAVPPSYHQSSNNIPLVESDPLSFLGGRSLTLLNDDHHHIKMSPSSSEAHSSSYVCQASGFLATGENNSDQKLREVTSLLLKKMEGEEEEEDDLLTLLAFERPHSLPASDLCSIVTSVDHQAEETTYNEGGLEAMFSQPSSSLDSDFINAMSGINNMWELGSCVWNNMPGAL